MDIFGPLLFLGLCVFLPLWLILKTADFIDRRRPERPAERNDSEDEQRRLAAVRSRGLGDGGGFGGGDGGGA